MTQKKYKNSKNYNVENFQNTLSNIDDDLSEIFGKSKIVISETTYRFSDYKYYILGIIILLIILIARAIT
jgi:TFIIF-interacting CTD phosphatase-like protein